MPSYNLAELKRANQKATIREVLSRLYPLGSNKIEKGEKIGTGGQGMKGVKSHLEDSSPLNLTLSDTACDMWPLPPTIIVEFSELKMTQRLLILTFPLELLLPYPYKLLYSPNLKRLLQMSHFPAAHFLFVSVRSSCSRNKKTEFSTSKQIYGHIFLHI